MFRWPKLGWSQVVACWPVLRREAADAFAALPRCERLPKNNLAIQVPGVGASPACICNPSLALPPIAMLSCA